MDDDFILDIELFGEYNDSAVSFCGATIMEDFEEFIFDVASFEELELKDPTLDMEKLLQEGDVVMIVLFSNINFVSTL